MNLLLLAAAAHAVEPTIPFEKYEVENGLDVILAPDRSTPIVHVNVWSHVGSRDEAPGRSGFAHLFEHLMFQGSESVEGEYFAPLQGVAADVDGAPATDRTHWLHGLPDDGTSSTLDRLPAVAYDDPRRAFSETVEPEEALWLVVGDEASLWDGLREMGFEAIEVDANG